MGSEMCIRDRTYTVVVDGSLAGQTRLMRQTCLELAKVPNTKVIAVDGTAIGPYYLQDNRYVSLEKQDNKGCQHTKMLAWAMSSFPAPQIGQRALSPTGT